MKKQIVKRDTPHFLKPKTIAQANYVKDIENNDIVFCTGPAGCGKTVLAVNYAYKGIYENKYERMIITRPVVEAGEKLGFLPGTSDDKLHPYLLPIYDELQRLIRKIGIDEFKTRGVLELCPLAFCRGRTFSNSIIIADEIQNATYEQIIMLLTRLGRGSKMLLNGDTASSDLIKNKQGGLSRIIRELNGMEGVGIAELGSEDILRHPLISKILERIT